MDDEVINNNQENNNITFWKKIYYSIFKIQKYEEMEKEGIKKAIKYFLMLVLIVSVIISIFLTYITDKEAKKIKTYFENNLPEFSIKDNELILDSEEAVILDSDETINLFGYVIVINPLLNEEEAINEYTNLAIDNNCVILLKDKVIAMPKGYSIENTEQQENNENGNEEKNSNQLKYFKYDEFLSNYPMSTNGEFGKQNILDYLSKPFTYYLTQYIVIYFIILFITFILDILVVGLLGIVALKLFKVDIKNKYEIFILSIYSFTLPIILQMIYSLLGFVIPLNTNIFQTILLLISYFYIMRIIYLKRK